MYVRTHLILLSPSFPSRRQINKTFCAYSGKTCRTKVEIHSCLLFNSTVDLANDIRSSKNDEMPLVINAGNMLINIRASMKLFPN